MNPSEYNYKDRILRSANPGEISRLLHAPGFCGVAARALLIFVFLAQSLVALDINPFLGLEVDVMLGG